MPEPDPSAELERRAEEFSVAYEDKMLVRAAVAAIPVIGSSLDLVFSSAGQASRERIHRLIDEMKDYMQERMETIENSAFDREYLESEEFRDLVMRAFDATIRTRDAAQRRTYAQILTESTIRSAREGHTPEEYLDLIAALTPWSCTLRGPYTKTCRERVTRAEKPPKSRKPGDVGKKRCAPRRMSTEPISS
jgi:hypothetical protein